ncbi:hypothetical protein NB709_001473 [Xanthomonas sacchari]|nr:hypothetical protein [Xanthomonas sacchari]
MGTLFNDVTLRTAYVRKVGGASRDRTGDLLHAMQALSQLSYGPTCCEERDVSDAYTMTQGVKRKFFNFPSIARGGGGGAALTIAGMFLRIPPKVGGGLLDHCMEESARNMISILAG